MIKEGTHIWTLWPLHRSGEGSLHLPSLSEKDEQNNQHWPWTMWRMVMHCALRGNMLYGVCGPQYSHFSSTTYIISVLSHCRALHHCVGAGVSLSEAGETKLQAPTVTMWTWFNKGTEHTCVLQKHREYNGTDFFNSWYCIWLNV